MTCFAPLTWRPQRRRAPAAPSAPPQRRSMLDPFFFKCCSSSPPESPKDVLGTPRDARRGSSPPAPDVVREGLQEPPSKPAAIAAQQRLMSRLTPSSVGLAGVATLSYFGYCGVEVIGNGVMIFGLLVVPVFLQLMYMSYASSTPVEKGGVCGDMLQPQVKASDDVASLLDHFSDHDGQKDPETRVDKPTCERFLKARKGNVEAARRAIEKYVIWRRTCRPGEMTMAQIQREMGKRKAYQHGTDRQGRPIIWVYALRHDKYDRDLEELSRTAIFVMEASLRVAEQNGLQHVCVVFNLSGFNFKCMDYEFVKRLIFLLGSYYPERLGQVLMWNAPSVFNIFWRIIRPWIDPVTVKKIDFVQADSLENYILPNMLPQEVVDGSWKSSSQQ